MHFPSRQHPRSLPAFVPAAVASLALALPALGQITETAKLDVPRSFDDVAFQELLGRAVSGTGSTIWLGEPIDNNVFDNQQYYNQGSVFRFERTSAGWELRQQLLASPPTQSAAFGWGLAFGKRWGIVGTSGDSTIQAGAGAVHLVEWVGGRWQETAKVYAPGIERKDSFGEAVAFSGDRVLVGSRGDDDMGPEAGSAFVFRKVGHDLVYEAKLLPRIPPQPHWAGVGLSVDISGDVAVLGAGGTYGLAVVFEKTPSGWKQTAILTDPQPTSWDEFGLSVAVEGDVIAIGEPVALTGDQYRIGSVFMYERTGPPPGNWTMTQKLHASNAALNPWGGDLFGTAVDLHDGRLLASAPWGKINGKLNGSAHIFEKIGGHWVETALLTKSGPKAISDFGRSVSLTSSFALIGSPLGEGSVPGIISGAAFVYELPFGEPICDALATSAGSPATMHATGSLAAAAGALELHARDLPPSEPGMFLVSAASQSPFIPPGSRGKLCLGGPMGRFTQSLASSGGAGKLDYVVDTSALPFSPPVTIHAGETWYFQTWFRDGTTSNFSPAIAIAFE